MTFGSGRAWLRHHIFPLSAAGRHLQNCFGRLRSVECGTAAGSASSGPFSTGLSKRSSTMNDKLLESEHHDTSGTHEQHINPEPLHGFACKVETAHADRNTRHRRRLNQPHGNQRARSHAAVVAKTTTVPRKTLRSSLSRPRGSVGGAGRVYCSELMRSHPLEEPLEIAAVPGRRGS